MHHYEDTAEILTSPPAWVRRRRIYVAGPMTSKPLYNYPAFDAAAERFRALGWEVVSPTDLDRSAGFNETSFNQITAPVTTDFLRGAMSRGLAAICECTAIALLPGWDRSPGTAVELALAKHIKLDIYDAETAKPFSETALQEASRLVYGDRGESYRHPLEDYTTTAAIWSAILRVPVTAEQAILCMIGVKMSRESRVHRRDSVVDIAGYAECLQMVHDERERRAKGQHDTPILANPILPSLVAEIDSEGEA